MGYRECTHNNCSDWVGGSIVGVGISTTGLGGWTGGSGGVLYDYIFYGHSLADCYRAPDPVTGKRNYTYMDVVKAHLGN